LISLGKEIVSISEVKAIRDLISRADSLEEIINICKIWRDVLCKRVRIKFRPYQTEFSDKIIEYVISEGIIGNEITVMFARQSGKTEAVAITTLALGLFYILFMWQDFDTGLFAPVQSMITRN